MTEPKGPGRFALPGWRTVLIGVLAASTGITALIVVHEPVPTGPRLLATVDDAAPAKAPADPLMPELLRCRLLPAGTDDAGCREAWEVNRRRFMGERRTYLPPVTAATTDGQ